MLRTINPYQDLFANTPPAGAGNSFHSHHLMRAANAAVRAGVSLDQFLTDIGAIPHKRHVPQKEIVDAYRKAQGDHEAGTFIPTPQPKPTVKNGSAVLSGIIAEGAIRTESGLSSASPIPIEGNETIVFLRTLFPGNPLVFIGDRYEKGVIGRNILRVEDWISFFQNGGTAGPFIIINPLSGKPAPTKTGEKATLRGDNCVSAHLHALIEFDTLSCEDQIGFFSGAKLPFVAVVNSGGKSIHAWLDVAQLADVKSAEDWQTHIKVGLYDQILTPMGLDPACCNAARLSRLPGFLREETGNYQRLLWLSPEGRRIAL